MKLENPTTRSSSAPAALDLEHFWMPFTANRQFKQAPRLLAGAKDMHYTTHDGRSVLDGTAGLWCVNAGHCRAPIVEAIQKQAATMDFAPTFQMGHPLVFEAATAVARITPEGMDRVFFTNSGSESVDTVMKIALAYHRARGESSRRLIIGRERGYHGTNFGGTAVGGIPGNRKVFPALMPIVDHLRSTHDLGRNAYSRGAPAHGVEFADELERLVTLHDPSNVAAVIVEPVAGSTGVLLPPRGYLERLREICTKHGILLIFDEVITGFGRLGTPFAADFFGVRPDMMTVAKAINNAAIPMGAVIVDNRIHDTIIEATPVGGIEFMHGYTYSGHPMAAAAVVATQKLYEDEQTFAGAAAIAPYFEEAVHSLRGARHVVDIRNLGLVAGIELEPRAGAPGRRAYEAFVNCFESGLLVRTTGDIIALSPPLIIEKSHIDQMMAMLRDAMQAVE
jgi:beta-alanine--pyruvate transaminase